MGPDLQYRLEVGGGLIPVGSVSSSDFSKLRSFGVHELLGEALRFYSFGNRWITKRNWPALDAARVDAAVYTLRFAFHEALKEKLHGLWLRQDLHEFVRPETLRYRGANSKGINWVFFDPTQKAILAARVFLSRQHRTTLFVEQPKPAEREYGGVFLDRVAPRLLEGRAQLEALLAPQDRPPPPAQSVPFFVDGMVYRALTAANQRPAPGGVELAEHLYVMLGYPGLAGKAGRQGDAPIPPRFRELRIKLEEWENTIASLATGIPTHVATALTKALQPFREWRAALGVLETRFATACAAPEAIPEFGLSWSLVLVYMLRWYLADIQIRSLMTALPTYAFYDGPWKRRFRGRTTHNAYLGLALYEALSGSPLAHVSIRGLLDYDFPVAQSEPADDEAAVEHATYGNATQRPALRLTGKSIVDWPRLARSSIFGEHDSRQVVKGFADWPVIVGFGVPPRDTRRQLTEGDATGTGEAPLVELALAPEAPKGEKRVYTQFELGAAPRWIRHQHPLVQHITASASAPGSRPNFYGAAGIERNSAASQLNVAATHGAQLRLFVASALLRRVARLFQLDDKYLARARPEPGPPPRADGEDIDPKRECARYGKAVAERRAAQARSSRAFFHLGAGSYAYGGSFEPHLTHTTGDVYDISIGTEIVHWPVMHAQVVLEVGYEVLDRIGSTPKSSQALANVSADGTYLGVRTMYEMHHLDTNWCHASLLADLKTLKSLQERALKAVADGTDDRNWTRAERMLRGTPHIEARSLGELAHIGHLCLLISGPAQIIYASPIIHLRSMRALQRAARRFDEGRGAERIYASAAAVIARAAFVCFPQNHHDHWHVTYGVGGASLPVDLWLRLGIDLRPYDSYLDAHRQGVHLNSVPQGELRELVDRDLKSTRELVVDYLARYAKLYPNAAYTENTSQLPAASPEVSEEADEAVRHLFEKLVDQPGRGEWLEPAIPRARGDVAAELVSDGDGIRRHVEDIYRLLGSHAQEARTSGWESHPFVGVIQDLLGESRWSQAHREVLEALLAGNVAFINEGIHRLVSAEHNRALFGLP